MFLKIKREETIHILNRLVKIPEDIANFTEQLMSRELKEEDFTLVKKAYLKLNPKTREDNCGFGISYKESYQLLFFQHFLDQSVKDEEIGSELISNYSYIIECAFENDIIKSTEDFMKAIIDLGFQKRDKEINSFLQALSSSKHKDFSKVYEIIFNSLNKRDNHFKFYSLIENHKDHRIGKVNFGKLLIETYSQTESSDSEKTIIEDIKLIQEELEKEEVERIEADKKRKEAEIERIK